MPAFNSEKYNELQTGEILKRIDKFNGKLYLEFGGKLFDDFHAARVLPGFKADAKLNILLTLKEKTEIIFIVNSKDLENNKIRADSNLPYGLDCLRIIDNLRAIGLFVSSIVITQYQKQKKADEFKQLLEQKGETVYVHTLTKGYPNKIKTIVSEKGYGANSFIKTSRPLVVVTATGPASGKLATCLSQLYHHLKNNEKAGYAKFETFPVWNLSIDDPINLAYEAATADIGDENMLDSFHLKAYGENAVNYNRDIEVFPILKTILKKIYGKEALADIYNSPTDMGVNKVGFAIENLEECHLSAKKEIARRLLKTKVEYKKGRASLKSVNKIQTLMDKLNINISDRAVVKNAMDLSKTAKTNVLCLQLRDGSFVFGKEKQLLSAPSAVVLNALKKLAGIDDDTLLLPDKFFKAVLELKKEYFGNFINNNVLSLKETLIILSLASINDEKSRLAFSKLNELSFCEAHSSHILRDEDELMLKNLLINITVEDQYFEKNLLAK